MTAPITLFEFGPPAEIVSDLAFFLAPVVMKGGFKFDVGRPTSPFLEIAVRRILRERNSPHWWVRLAVATVAAKFAESIEATDIKEQLREILLLLSQDRSKHVQQKAREGLATLSRREASKE